MTATAKKPKKKSAIHITFANDLEPKLWQEFQEGVINANLKDHVPAHMQRPLVDKFVEAGFMRP